MGVAVKSAKQAKTSSKTHLQLRTVSANTCVCLLPQWALKWRVPLTFRDSHKTDPPQRFGPEVSFDIDQLADRKQLQVA